MRERTRRKDRGERADIMIETYCVGQYSGGTEPAGVS